MYSDQQLKELGDGLAQGKDVKDIKLTPGKPKKPRNNEESRAQRELFNWWNRISMLKFGIRSCLMHSVPNGGFRSVVTASIMKAEGQTRGVFDIKLNVPRRGKHGLWIEMKASKGVLSPDQVEFQCCVEDQGYETAVCRSAMDAVGIISGYLK